MEEDINKYKKIQLILIVAMVAIFVAEFILCLVYAFNKSPILIGLMVVVIVAFATLMVVSIIISHKFAGVKQVERVDATEVNNEPLTIEDISKLQIDE